jgi:hydroxymethylbilane synthase
LNALQRIVIASRESRLALWQAEHVRDLLASRHPGLTVEILGMTTRGDRILDVTLSKVGGKGLFVKELETAIAEGRADFAVHSAKDVPMELPEGFVLPAIMAREDPCDAFVSARYASLADLPAGAVVGTSSLRREAQLRERFPRLSIQPLRGNLDTRLAKLDRGEYAGIVLAVAGLRRLGLGDRIREILSTEASLPAAGQGALAIECRADRPEVAALLAALGDADTSDCVRAERAVSKALGGSCQLPLGAHAVVEGGEIFVRGLVASPDGRRIARAEARGARTDPEAVGRALADALLGRGAAEILASLPQ